MKPRHQRSQLRARYTRTNQPIGDLLTNSPAGFPSSYAPVYWNGQPLAGNSWEADTLPVWWQGSDQPWGPIGPHGPGSNSDGIAAVHRATNLIVDPIVTSRWKVMRPLDAIDTATAAVEAMPVAPRWITDPMLTRPDERFPSTPFPVSRRLSSSVFWGQLVRDALWFGTGAMLYIADSTGQPIPGAMRLLSPWMFEPADNGGYRIGDEADYVVTDPDGSIEVGGQVWRVFDVRNPHSPVDEHGQVQGVFARFPHVFGLHSAMDTYAHGIFAGSGVPTGFLKVLTPGMTQEQADELKRKWTTAHRGDRRSVAVLNATTEYHRVQMSPLDTALRDMKQTSVFDIAHAFNLDPEMLSISGGGGYLYSNWNDRIASYRISSLNPWTVVLQENLRALFAGGTGVYIDLGSLLRADTASRFDSYDKAIKAGFYTRDEVRALEGLPPLSDDERAEMGLAPRTAPLGDDQ